MEYCVLPLGSQYIHEKVPLIKSVLLYGMPRTGKTLLTQAVANLAGANFFNLSPRNTDGKYPGKAAALMVHMVFKVQPPLPCGLARRIPHLPGRGGLLLHGLFDFTVSPAPTACEVPRRLA